MITMVVMVFALRTIQANW